MLFVGFSLQDDNFHKIVDSIRKAVSSQDTDSDANKDIGLTIQLFAKPYSDELWRNELHFICMEGHIKEKTGADFSRAGRKLEIFLDMVSMKSVAAESNHVLDPHHESILSDEERKVKDIFTKFIAEVPENVKQDPCYRHVRHLLSQLGLP